MRAAPNHLTVRMAKKQRTGKVFLDYLRNAREDPWAEFFNLRQSLSAAALRELGVP